jgi:N-methylhydantoinase B
MYYLGGKEFIPPMKTKVTGVRMKQGDRLVIKSPGGGGYGDPFERDPDIVLRDVRMEYISAKSAKKDYGVVIVKRDSGMAVDYEATSKLRKK